VARLVAYAEVLEAAEAVGLRCVYPNGAAFAPTSGDWAVAGWITGEDASVRSAFRERVRRVAPSALANEVFQAWSTYFHDADEAWIAPAHHWAAELAHGRGDGATARLLQMHSIDTTPLMTRTAADAIALSSTELPSFLAALYDAMGKADFTLLLPGTPMVATVHHHRQCWWRTADAAVADALLR
jgi:hypothetical protein